MVGTHEWWETRSPEEQHTFDYDLDGEEELGPEVTTAVASVTGSAIEDVSHSLTESVDPDVLDWMFRPTGKRPPTALRVVLTVDGCFVTVTSDGRITVEP